MEIAPRIIYNHYAFSDNPQVQQQMQMQMQMQMQHQLQQQLQVQPHQQIGYLVPVNMNMNLGCVPVPMSNVPIIPYDTTAASSPSSSTSTSTSGAAAGPAAAPPPSACAPGVYPAYYQPSIPSTSSPPYAYAANIPQTQFYDTTPTTTTTAATQPQAFKLPPISSIMQGGASSAKSSVSSTSSAGTIHSSPLAAPGNMPLGGMAPMTPPASAAHSPRSASAEQATPVVAATPVAPVAATTSTAPSKKSKRKKFICDGIGKHLSPEVRQKKQCPVCGKKCSRPSTLKTHYLIHTGDNPYVCTRPGCDKSFNVKSNLQRHIRSHDRKLAKTLAQMQQYGPLY